MKLAKLNHLKAIKMIDKYSLSFSQRRFSAVAQVFCARAAR
jgi:hypothetical protein